MKQAIEDKWKFLFLYCVQREVFCLWLNSQEVARNQLLSDAFPVNVSFTGQFVAVLFCFMHIYYFYTYIFCISK